MKIRLRNKWYNFIHMRSLVLFLKKVGLQKIVGIFIALVLIIVAGLYVSSRPKVISTEYQQSFNQSGYAKSIPELEKWVSQNKGDTVAAELLAALYIQKAEEEPLVANDNLSKAMAILSKIADGDKHRSETFRLMGVASMDWGSFLAATRYFKKALSIDPGNLDAKAGLAMTYEHDGKWAEAFAAYNSILKANPNHEMAGLGMARYYLNKSDGANATKYATAVASSSKNYSSLGEANGVIGSAMMIVNRYDDAIKYYTESLKYRPGNAHTSVLLGDANVSKYAISPAKDRPAYIAAATAAANKALALRPNYIYALNLLYKIDLLQNKYDDANKLGKSILQLLAKDKILSAAEKAKYAEYYKGDITSVKVKSVKINDKAI